MRPVWVAYIVVLAAPTFGGTVRIDGNHYTYDEHPRVFFDGPHGPLTTSLKDPDGREGSVAPRVSPGDAAYEAMRKVVRPCVADHVRCRSANRSFVTALAALDWFMDNDQTRSLAAVKYWLNHIEMAFGGGGVKTQFGCDYRVPDCGLGSLPDWRGLDMPYYMMAYTLVRSEMSSAERATFARKMLNDVESANEDGTCDPQFRKLDGVRIDYQGGSTTLTAASGLSALRAGRTIFAKRKEVDSREGYGGLGVVKTVDSDTTVTLEKPLAYWSGPSYGGISNGVLLELQPWGTDSCGAVWMLKNDSNPFPVTFGHRRVVHNVTDVSASSTTVTVDDASGLPRPPFPMRMRRGEWVNVTGVSGNTLTIERGHWGTAAQPQPASGKADKTTMIYNKYAPRGATNGDPTNNRFTTKTAALMSIGIALLDDDPRARVVLEESIETYRDYTQPRLSREWTGLSRSGGRYQFARTYTNVTQMADMTRRLRGSPSLDFTGGNWLKNVVYEVLYLGRPDANATDLIGWGEPIAGAPEEWNHNWLAFVLAFYPRSEEAAYIRNWVEDAAGLYSERMLQRGSHYRELVWYLIHLGPGDPKRSYRSLPLARAFNEVDDPPGRPQAAWVSRTGWSSPDDTVVFADARRINRGSDHHGLGGPGSYRIYKGGYLMTDNHRNENSELANTNMLLFAGKPNLRSARKDDQEVWLDRDAVGSGWAYARIDSTRAYTKAARATRVLRHLVHFTRGAPARPDHLVVYDDVASSAGNTKSFNLHYDKTSKQTSAMSDPSVPSLAWTGPDRRLGTAVVLPSGPGVAGTYKPVKDAHRLTLCASADGTACDATNTSAEFLLVHRPSLSPTDTMPSVELLESDDGHRAVQIGDPTTPMVAVFPRAGKEYGAVELTSDHGGKGQYLVVGLVPGSYDVSRGETGIVVEGASVGTDGALHFESASGELTVSLAKAGEPAGTLR